ncbi:MAG: ABC transporter, fused permease protein [uncultured Gemmatimonadaceae bacterium]|uniref:ABC transporter, fused permease protein n=1 Tax=uncultured Gemmatimonadaceae bacterium TaxID=246130 RepID=A0A6J4LZG2_9BACT|nr:MAG: ABC transporter, fused permease protein [uncultured Gemmatimonadaceae bacterium]
MLKLALRGMRARKARTAFTLLAVVLGVALIAGTFVLTDTIGRSFDRLVASTGENVDVKVLPASEDGFDDATPSTIPASVADRAEGIAGVKEVSAGFEQAPITLIDDEGERIGPATGAPTFAFSARSERFDAFAYEGGRQPEAADEIAVGQKAAEEAGLEVGDTVGVQGTGPVRRYTITALTTFGGAGALGGAAFAVLTLPEVQRLADEPGRVTEVAIEAESGVAPAALEARVSEAIGRDYRVRTGAEDQASNAQDFKEILSYLTIGLLVFGLISLLVGAFVIFNTFTITVAQRTREFGLLRTIGASRRQILRSVVLEAALIGVLGSLLGLLAGIGLAPLLRELFGLIGFDLPSQALVIAARTVIASVLVGTVVTLLASLGPALRATRVSPMAALREGAVGRSTRRRKSALAAQSGVAALGVALMLVGLFAGFETSTSLIVLGIGAVLVFVGVGLLSPLLVGPLAALIGRPLEAAGGVAGKIARGNAVRAPGRTAGTAAALMIGVALVAFVAIFVNGFKASFSGAFEKAVTADYVIINNAGLLPEGVARSVETVPGVEQAANLRVGNAKLGKDSVALAGLDPRTFSTVVKVDWSQGTDDTFRGLGPREAVVETGFAEERRLRVGSTLTLRSRAGDRVPLTVRGIYEDRGQLLGAVTLPDATLRDAFGVKQVLAALIRTAPGEDGKATQRRLDAALDGPFPSLEAQTREEFIDQQVGAVNQILYLFYVLLALSVIIALFGIVNTLALSVYERTREIGLLRAVGTSRRQVRRIVRGEAVITAVMGALLGVAIGVLFGVLVSRPLEAEGFVLALPFGTLAVLVILGALAGVLAAVVPARRASRIDVLRALQYD